FDRDRYWEITVDYAKASPEDLLVRVSVRNAGPEAATIDVLPTLWYRNTWSWGYPAFAKPELRLVDGAVVADDKVLTAEGTPDALFCENETNTKRLFGDDNETPFPKDGINDHVVHGAE